MSSLAADDAPSETDAGEHSDRARRAGLRWWILASVSVVLGTTIGVAIARIGRPAGPGSISSNVITATGGVFTAEHGTQAPDWTLPALERPASTVALAQFRGRPVVVNFWASWCPPCRKEMPALEHVARLLNGRVDFVGLDTQDERSAGLAFARGAKVSYALATDNAEVWSSYGVYGLPTTVFISASGELLGRQVGGLTEARLEALVRQVFEVSVSGS